MSGDEQEYPWETRHSPKGAGRKAPPPMRPKPSQVRLACGHYADAPTAGESPNGCPDPECADASPDPWDLADEPNRYHRLEETRAYRQSKARNR